MQVQIALTVAMQLMFLSRASSDIKTLIRPPGWLCGRKQGSCVDVNKSSFHLLRVPCWMLVYRLDPNSCTTTSRWHCSFLDPHMQRTEGPQSRNWKVHGFLHAALGARLSQREVLQQNPVSPAAPGSHIPSCATALFGTAMGGCDPTLRAGGDTEASKQQLRVCNCVCTGRETLCPCCWGSTCHTTAARCTQGLAGARS